MLKDTVTDRRVCDNQYCATKFPEPLIPDIQKQATFVEVKLPLIFYVLHSAKASCIDPYFPASLLMRSV
jgi:hypothetical protein